MVVKPYEWINGAELEDHSKCKHKILREYFFEYLSVRCQLPKQEKFRLAVIDGFAGGGRYNCGSPGSPIIFIEEIHKSIRLINTHRAVQGLGSIQIECLCIFNDATSDVINFLKSNVSPLISEIKNSCSELHIQVEYMDDFFEAAYPKIKERLLLGRYRNVIFNLDQCGHVHVERNTLLDIIQSFSSAEIFYTFAIESLLAFLPKSNPSKLATQLAAIDIDDAKLENLDGAMSTKNWLGTAERIVFETFRMCSPFVSPFSIHNPDGWRYWLIHFSKSYRARQVYNNILHQNSSMQAHFGRSGLNMLAYNPELDDGRLFLFDAPGRAASKEELLDDIPRVITEYGDVLDVAGFYESIYNMTPAHMDDINSAIIENPDIEVITQAGGERRKANTIAISDLIKLKKQTSFFPMFLGKGKKQI